MMTEQQDHILAFAIIVAIGATIAAIAGVGVMLGFALGGMVTIGAAVIAAALDTEWEE
jgi:hypothetical protein